jgi:hypothetical protein
MLSQQSAMEQTVESMLQVMEAGLVFNCLPAGQLYPVPQVPLVVQQVLAGVVPWVMPALVVT